MLKQSLQQKMLQKLSPLQIQVIKLLEIPTAQLEQRIKEELEQNPVLEYGSETQDYDDDYGEEADTPESDIEKDELSIEDYIHDDE
ncbi:MAG TPA: RNA polymerase sigma-54 factor, partial [Bacteroidales bacterium]|nr:RNA polymerase sigma-54 factor [Bacteroidales bacterium]